MDIYVAHQPIFSRKEKVIGYELLYRSGLTNSYGGTDGAHAFLTVIRNAFLFLGQRIAPQPSQAYRFTEMAKLPDTLCKKVLLTTTGGS
jgi:c-di-GMP phosphodiesterase